MELATGFEIPKVSHIIDPGNLQVVRAILVDAVTQQGERIPCLDFDQVTHIRG